MSARHDHTRRKACQAQWEGGNGIALMWRGGCIIRSTFLGKIKEDFEAPAELANLQQAQRDYFGAHTYERIDRPSGDFFHTNRQAVLDKP